ncbi:MAG: class I SAM-dependent methyltransferase [bacterium]|nr:class I SAM-dependent methyltransferase [bacterium]
MSDKHQTPENTKGENTKEVKAFFEKWDTYRKAMDNDYAGHIEAYKALGDFLKTNIDKPFSIFDLGCGNAEFMAQSLKNTLIQRYEAVDISESVLELAEKNMSHLNCEKYFFPGDFINVIHNRETSFDVIWIGLSFHHLSYRQKEKLLERCSSLLTKGGYFIIFDPVSYDNETLENFRKRWWNTCHLYWNALTHEEKLSIKEHVDSADFPESLSTYKGIGGKYGFSEVESVFIDPTEIYQIIYFQKT